MRLGPPSGATRAEFERLRSEGDLQRGLALGRAGRLDEAVGVSALAEGDFLEWAAPLSAALDTRTGVVGVSGRDTRAAAQVAVLLAAWLGERGLAVTVVDSCVEEPVLRKPLPEDGDEGLVDSLLFGVSSECVVRRTLATGVSVVTAGSHPVTVRGVFEAAAYGAMLRGLAGDGLALVVLEPARLGDAAASLDALVCVVEDGGELSSLAATADSTRTVTVLLGDIASEEDQRGLRERQMRPLEVGDAEPSERPQTDAGEEPAGSVEEAFVRPEPLVVGAALERKPRKRRGLSVLVTLVVIVAAAAVWWGLDGRERFGPSAVRDRVPPREVAAPGRQQETGPADSGEEATAPEGGAESMTAEREDQPGGEPVSDLPAEAVAIEEQTGGADATSGDVSTEGRPLSDERIHGPGGRYLVMVSSHKMERDAGFEATEIERKGVDVDVVAAEVPDRGTWYRIVVSGGYPRHAAALEVLDTIKSLGYEGAWIEFAPRPASDG